MNLYPLFFGHRNITSESDIATKIAKFKRFYSSYVIMAPDHFRPNQAFRVAVNIIRLDDGPFEVIASIRNNGTEIVTAQSSFSQPGTKTIELKVRTLTSY